MFLNFLEKTSWKNILFFLSALTLCIHFSLPLIITFDSGHYHEYLSILHGQSGLNQWDPARQPGFPLFIYLVHYVFGSTQHAFLLAYFIIFTAVLALVIYFLWEYYNCGFTRLVGVLLIGIFLVLDPISIGFFHVLLTEALAGAVAVIASFYALKYFFFSIQNSNSWGCFAIFFIFWVVLIVVAYNLKQIYVLCALCPFLVSTILSLFYISSFKRKLIQLCAFIIVFGLLIISTRIWGYFILKDDNPYFSSRTSSNMLKQMVVNGFVTRAKKLGIVSQIVNSQNNIQQKNDLVQIINKKVSGKSLNPDCSLIYRFKTEDNPAYVIFPCKETSASFKDLFNFVCDAILVAPFEIIAGFTEGFLRIVRVMPSGLSIGDKKYENMPELEVIGLKTFRNEPNYFWLTDSLAMHVKSYFQEDAHKARGILGRLPYKLFGKTALYLFTFILLFSTAIVPISIWLFIKLYKYQSSPSPTLVFTIISSVTILFLLLAHVILGATIDRYAFSAYFLGLSLFCIILTHFSNLIISYKDRGNIG